MENYNSHYFYEPVKIIEGFDMVGKSTFLSKILPSTSIYHANHDLTDKTIGRNNSWSIGYGIIDFLYQLKENNPESYRSLDITIDRGVMSSYVYQRLYSNSYLYQEVVESYSNNEFFKKSLGHIYLVHHDTSTAEEIFVRSQSRDKNPNEISNKLDTFRSFRDYWVLYTNADLLFREIYRKLGITPRVFETLPDYKWEEVQFK